MKSNLFTKGIASLFLLFLFIFLATPFLQAQAQLTPACGYDLNKDGKYVSGYPDWEGCRLCHFFVLGDNILDFLLLPPDGLVLIGAVIMLVAGGFIFLTSSGNPGKLDQGKQIIKTTFIGLIIIYGAWLAIDFFFVMIGAADWTGLQEGWFIIKCPTS